MRIVSSQVKYSNINQPVFQPQYIRVYKKIKYVKAKTIETVTRYQSKLNTLRIKFNIFQETKRLENIQRSHQLNSPPSYLPYILPDIILTVVLVKYIYILLTGS